MAEKEREKQEKAIAAQMSIQEKSAQANMQKLNDDTKYKEEKLRAEEAYKLSSWTMCKESDDAKHATNMARNKYALEESELESKSIKAKADAQAYANEAILKAFGSVDKEILLAILLSGMDSKTLIAKAFNSLAENAGKIGNLNISPDLLEALTNASEEE